VIKELMGMLLQQMVRLGMQQVVLLEREQQQATWGPTCGSSKQ